MNCNDPRCHKKYNQMYMPSGHCHMHRRGLWKCVQRKFSITELFRFCVIWALHGVCTCIPLYYSGWQLIPLLFDHLYQQKEWILAGICSFRWFVTIQLRWNQFGCFSKIGPRHRVCVQLVLAANLRHYCVTIAKFTEQGMQTDAVLIYLRYFM